MSDREKDKRINTFTLNRQIYSSDIWFASPWKLKVWIYLIGNANHTAGKFYGILVERGQLIRSFRTIADDCAYMIGYRKKKPSVSTIRRICEELTKDARITLRTTHHGSLITILNYEDFQPIQNIRTNQRTKRQQNSSRTAAEQSNKNNKKNNAQKEKERKENLFDSFWDIWPNKKDKAKALKSWMKLELTDELYEIILKAVQSQVKWREKAGEGEFRPYWKLPTTWLNGNNWEDVLPEDNPHQNKQNYMPIITHAKQMAEAQKLKEREL